MTTSQDINQIDQITSYKIIQNLLVWTSLVFLAASMAVSSTGNRQIKKQEMNESGLQTASDVSAIQENNRLRILVQYAPGKRTSVERALSASAAEFHYAFDELNTFAVTIPATAFESISHNPGVVFIEEDVPRYPIAVTSSKNTSQASVDYMALPNQVVPYGVDMVQARDVWDVNRDGVVDSGAPTGAGRKICIIDSGFYTAHEDLQGVNVNGYNGNLSWDMDGSGHGTHVAGTIVAMNNTLGVVGVTPGTVSIYEVRVFGDDGAWAYSSTLIDAANRCASAGANIISMSLGGSLSSRTERIGFANLYDQGILSIAAAGNDGNNRNSYPASYDSVVSVAAIDSSKTVASFSQYNNQVELAAPGVGVLSTVPYLDTTTMTVDGVAYSAGHIEFSARGSTSGALVDGGLCDSVGAWSGKAVLCQRGNISFYEKVNNVQSGGGVVAVVYNNVPGDFLGTLGSGNSSAIIAISLSQEDGQFLVANKLGLTASVSSSYIAPGSGYEYYDGTSMATPHVSAVAALVWSSKPSATNTEIRSVLQQTAEDLGAAGRDNFYGYGLVQAKAAIDALTSIPTSTVTATPTGTATFTPTATNTATDTPTGTATNTPTSTNTATFTPTATNTATNTPTDTATFTPTSTRTATATPTDTATFTATSTSTASKTLPNTATSTVTLTPVAETQPFKVYLPMVLNNGTTNQPEGDSMLTNKQKSLASFLDASIQAFWKFFYPGSP